MECNKCQNWILIEDEIDEHGEEVFECLNPCTPMDHLGKRKMDNYKKREGYQDYFSRRVYVVSILYAFCSIFGFGYIILNPADLVSLLVFSLVLIPLGIILVFFTTIKQPESAEVN